MVKVTDSAPTGVFVNVIYQNGMSQWSDQPILRATLNILIYELS
jgi:hypothetical protein